MVCSISGDEYKKMFKEEQSIEISKTLCLITNIEEYQKMYNYDRRKGKSRI